MKEKEFRQLRSLSIGSVMKLTVISAVRSVIWRPESGAPARNGQPMDSMLNDMGRLLEIKIIFQEGYNILYN